MAASQGAQSMLGPWRPVAALPGRHGRQTYFGLWHAARQATGTDDESLLLQVTGHNQQ